MFEMCLVNLTVHICQITELAMCQCSAHLRSRTEWWQDVQNEEVRHEWQSEAMERRWIVRTPSGHSEINLSKRQVRVFEFARSETCVQTAGQVDYILDELSGYAALVDKEHKWRVDNEKILYFSH